MPLDKRLNKDLHEAVNKHYILTNDLGKDDICRFGMETPRQVSSSYRRIWDPDTGVAPSSDRIVQDFKLVWEDAIPRIIAGKGICLDDNSIKGKRHTKRTKVSGKWGGKRVRKQETSNYDGGHGILHQHAMNGIRVKIEKAENDFAKLMASQSEKLGAAQANGLEDSTLDALGYALEEGGDEDEIVLVDRDAEMEDVGAEENFSTDNS